MVPDHVAENEIRVPSHRALGVDDLQLGDGLLPGDLLQRWMAMDGDGSGEASELWMSRSRMFLDAKNRTFIDGIEFYRFVSNRCL